MKRNKYEMENAYELIGDTVLIWVDDRKHGCFKILIDKEDLHLISIPGVRWRVRIQGRLRYCQYSKMVKGKRNYVQMHRLLCYLELNDNLVVDHINGDGLDNRRKNLRVVTKAQNSMNTHKHRKKLFRTSPKGNL